MIRALVLSGLMAAACAVPAFAGQSLTAQLQSPVAAPMKLVAAGATWRCDGATCEADATTDRTLGLEGCRALAKEVGPVASYGAAFDAAKLAKCDAGLSAPGAAPGVAKADKPAAVASAR